MEFTQKEALLVKAAIKSRNKNKILQPLLLIFLIVSVVIMTLGFISGENFTYISFFLIFLSIMSPQLGPSPKYVELVDILEKKLALSPSMEDVLSEELEKI
jgi:hypothetical protein